MNKASIRETYKQKRIGLEPGQRNRLDDLLMIQWQRVDCSGVELVMSYYPITKWKEFNPSPWIEFLRFQYPELKTAYPVVASAEPPIMQAHEVSEDTTWITHSWGMAEPVGAPLVLPGQIDLVVVPLLAFDTRGYRVGYGKGFYDSFLAQTRNDCAWIGVSYFPPVETPIADIHAGDLPLDLVVTPEEIYTFPRN